MAQESETRRVVTFSSETEKDLLEIYDHTAEHWGDEQAETYSNFLLNTTQLLADNPVTAPLVPNMVGVRSYVARWKNARQGHWIIFEETPEGINVVRVLHTARSGQGYFD